MSEEKKPISISMQWNGQDVLKYLYTPNIEFIPDAEIEKLRVAIERFITYTLTQPEREEPR